MAVKGTLVTPAGASNLILMSRTWPYCHNTAGPSNTKFAGQSIQRNKFFIILVQVENRYETPLGERLGTTVTSRDL
jgi:hypothetical protein